jgi:hypothetical protein
MGKASVATWCCTVVGLLIAGAAACGGDQRGEVRPTRGASTVGAASTAEVLCEVSDVPPEPRQDAPTEPDLRREFLEMAEADQAERTGKVITNNDVLRTDRLRDVMDKHGWPDARLVGADGASAAWLVAQHADHDVAFQRRALELMCPAVAAGTADATELAYLEDRVAVNSGRAQIYGTQFGGCEDGRPVPRPLADDAGVHERRAKVGLQPLDEYLAQFQDACDE